MNNTERSAAIAARRRHACYEQHREDLIRLVDFRDNQILAHARRELPSAADNERQHVVNRLCLAAVALFGCENLTPFEGQYAVETLHKLLRWQPLGALAGDATEWSEPFDDEGHVRNTRMPEVIRTGDGRAFWLTGYVFREPPEHPGDEDWHTFTCQHSRMPIEGFPWLPPAPVMVDVERDADDDTCLAALRAAGLHAFADMPRLDTNPALVD
ncbi:MAG: hypothetical protein OXC08_20855 [Thiotrichales bacterium]|nr:hypothetical protein [Thiotrichales bacterium]